MKLDLNAGSKPSTSDTKFDTAKKAAEAFFMSHLLYYRMLFGLGNKGTKEIVATAMRSVARRCDFDYNAKLFNDVMPKAIARAWIATRRKLKNVTRHFLLAPSENPAVISRDPDVEVPRLWRLAVKVMNRIPFVLDSRMFEACKKHAKSLKGQARKTYMPWHVAEVLSDVLRAMRKARAIYIEHGLLQLSGRGGQGGRGAFTMYFKISRSLFLFSRAYDVSRSAKKCIANALADKHGLCSKYGSITTWAKKIVEAYDVTSAAKADELSNALMWLEVCETGKTARGLAFDANTSGLVNQLCQFGSHGIRYFASMVDANHPRWKKLHRIFAKALMKSDKLSRFLDGLPMEAVIKIAKLITQPGMYAGGMNAITMQFFDGVEYNRNTKEWRLPKEHRKQTKVTLPLQDWMTVLVEDGMDNQEFLNEFCKEFAAPAHRVFLYTFPFIARLTAAFGKWAEEDPENLVLGIKGWKYQSLNWRLTKRRSDKPIKFGDGQKEKLYRCSESANTELMAFFAHNLDSAIMMMTVIRLKIMGIPCRWIHDAVIVPAPFIGIAMEVYNEVAMQVHSECHLPQPVQDILKKDDEGWEWEGYSGWKYKVDGKVVKGSRVPNLCSID